MKKLDDILAQYYQLVSHALSCSKIVGEDLKHPDQTSEARLLCQTRCVYFLTQYSVLYNAPDSLESAVSLYNNTRELYKREGYWKDRMSSLSKTDDLYEYAFIVYAESRLFIETKNHDVKESAYETLRYLFSLIANKEELLEISKQGQDNICQNPLMHLFECLLMAWRAFQDTEIMDAVSNLLLVIEEHFFDQDLGLIKETVDSAGDTLWFEPGHSYEWACLLDELKSEMPNLSSKITPENLMAAAEKHGVNSEGYVLPEIHPNKSAETAEKFRIWPQLERVRAYSILNNQTRVDEIMTSLVDRYFDSELNPIEYKWLNNGQDIDYVKSTTGYHIMTSFSEVKKCLTGNV
ncbi:AGE family epimerase/isomerase [Hahella sp. CCB-MM4]|uniref:AGE family epimerase/isomerase n=1 Tax=Hahella sp. (strain CCB-MM4) TaxID=1926491 RepID=UPI00143D81AE|nr:AGE family epimerase/isomerase [Hahella sp. CCB-MM4]